MHFTGLHQNDARFDENDDDDANDDDDDDKKNIIASQRSLQRGP